MASDYTMRHLNYISTLGLVLLGCSGSARTEGPVELAGESTFITTDSETTAPAVSLYPQVQAHTYDPETGARVERAVELDGGLITVPDAPPGEVYLVIEPFELILVTELRDIDLGHAVLGREGLELVQLSGTQVRLELSGLEPWEVGDELHLFSPGARVYWTTLSHGLEPRDAISPGDTASTHLTAYPEVPAGLIDATKGDHAFVYQLSLADVGGVTAKAAVRVADVTDFTLGMSISTLPAPLAEPGKTSSFELSWPVSAFEGLEADVGQNAFAAFHDFYLSARPGAAKHGFYGYSSDLIHATREIGEGDVEAAIPYHHAFPEEWPTFAHAVTWFASDYETSGGQRVYARAWRYEREAAAAGTPLEPLISPPLNVRVEGKATDTDLELSSPAPEVEWDPPTLGEPSYYRVDVYSGMALAHAGTLLTHDTRVKIPHELAFSPMVLTVTAVHTEIDFASRPLVHGIPSAGAPAMTRVLFAPEPAP